jgi:peptidyl-prolyl cis-trans isomerase D
MLNSLRQSAGSWFVKILLGVLVLSFAIWGVGDMFRTVSRQKLAEVGDREISAAEFQRTYQNQLALVSNQIGRRVTSAEARSFQIGERVMDNLIGTTAVAIHADKLNLGISQDTVAEAIRNEASFHGPDGKFDQQRFQEVLRSNGLDEARFIQIQREEMVRGQLMDALTRGAFVPKTLLDAANHYRNDERVLKYFVLPPEAAGTVEAPDETVLRSYYDSNKLRYMAPEYRKIGVLALTPDAIKDTIALTDEEVKASFEATKSAYSTPERRGIQQLIFKDMAAAQDAHKKLTEGADFAALGAEIGLKETDMALGTLAKSQLADPKIAEAAFALEQGKFSAPIDSFSPVIVKVTEIAPGSEKTFEEVKGQVHDALAKSRAAEEISKLYDAIEDERASGSNIAETAKKLNLPYAEYTVDASGGGQDGKPVTGAGIGRESLQLAFTSDVGVENSPVTMGDGYSFLEVREVIPERQKTFEEVRDQVQAAWITDETRKRMRQKADELVVKLKGGTAIETVAQEAGVQVTTSPPLKRDAAPEGLPRTAMPLAFSLAQNDFGTVQMPDRKSQAILQVTEIKPATPLDEKQAEALSDEMRRGVGVDILTQYVGGLQQSYGVTRDQAAISALAGQQ